MLGLLLALLGGMVGLAGGGGGSKAAVTPSGPAPTTAPTDVIIDPAPIGDPGTGDEPGSDTPPEADDGGAPPPATGGGIGVGGGEGPMGGVGGHGGGGGHGGHSDDEGGGMPMVGGGGGGGHGGGHGGHSDDEGGGMPMVGDGGTEDDTGSGTGGHGGHGGHGGGTGMGTLPTTPAEVKAFVAAIRAGTDVNVHDHDSPLHGEHMMAMQLVDPAEASHIAISHGSWFDPDNWHNGEVPGDDANVVIPQGVYMEYDEQSDDRIFTLRVDGHLEFANDVDSKMVVDTFVVTPGGQLTIGTEEAPVADDVNVEIVIANNGKIDTDWDPALLSRGLISHGKTEIHGQMKDSHEKVTEDPMAGDRSISFDGIPEGWEVGDKIVIAGTHYEGYSTDKQTKERVYHETEDEVRIITKIKGDEVFFDEPLEHDHDTPRADLKTSVANYSRNVTIRSEDGDDGEIYERGHVMMMHSDDVDIRYAAFEELGRTDKSEDLHNDLKDAPAPNEYDSNVAGRYGLHLHRTGVDDQNNPTYLEGNAVFGSPGWGIVHHDSHAVISNNATYDTYGAGFVAETGNETGSWTDNIAINAQGVDWGGAKGTHEPGSLNIGISGDGFWFTGRMVDASDNVAASVNHGYIYFHRVPSQEGGKLPYDAELFEFGEALSFNDETAVNETPILVFEDNEAFAARMALHVIKANPVQGHDIHSVFDGFTGWSVEDGVNLQYTAHYILKDFDLIAAEGKGSQAKPDTGIGFGKNTFDITIVDAQIEGFKYGLDLKKGYSSNMKNVDEDTEHGYTVVNTDLTDNKNDFRNLTDEDDVLGLVNTQNVKPSLDLDGPLSYANSEVEISGTKTDSLGTRDFPHGPDDFSLDRDDVARLLEENGYYTTPNGDNYMVLDIYFSDTLTGDVFTQSELVAFDDKAPLGEPGHAFEDAKFNGKMSLKDLKAMTKNSVEQVRDNDAVEARTIEDFEQAALEEGTAPMDHGHGHGGHGHAGPVGHDHGSQDHAMHQTSPAQTPADGMHEGEAIMAAISNGQNMLSETMPAEDALEEHAHQDMAMA